MERNLIQMTEPGDMGCRVRRILESARAVCQSDAASLLLLNEDRTEMYFQDAVGTRSEDVLGVRLPVDEHSVAGSPC